MVAIFFNSLCPKKVMFYVDDLQFSAATSEAAEDVQGSFGQF